MARKRNERILFRRRQAISLVTAVLITLSVLSVWFDDPRRLTTGLGLVTAGLAFALQKVVTAFAGYLVIVGERTTMGGVRGDVISLGFLQTTIMEMGQPESVQNADPATWVGGRQYTERLSATERWLPLRWGWWRCRRFGCGWLLEWALALFSRLHSVTHPAAYAFRCEVTTFY